jgi:hypothetical protein
VVGFVSYGALFSAGAALRLWDVWEAFRFESLDSDGLTSFLLTQGCSALGFKEGISPAPCSFLRSGGTSRRWSTAWDCISHSCSTQIRGVLGHFEQDLILSGS